jgi:hypothetical protein
MITLLRIRHSPELPPLQDLFEHATKDEARIILQALVMLCVERGNHILLYDENSPDQSPIELSVISFDVNGPDCMALLSCLNVHLTLDVCYEDELPTDCSWMLVPEEIRRVIVAPVHGVSRPMGVSSPMVSFAQLAQTCGSLGLVGKIRIVQDSRHDQSLRNDHAFE